MSEPKATARFAQFLGLSKAAKKGEDKKPDPDAGDEDKDTNASVVSEDDESDKPGSKGKRAEDKKDDLEGDDDDANAEDEDDEAGAEDDGDDDKDAKAKKSAKAERARAGRIIAHGIDAGCVEAAAVLAFTTGMSSAAAIRVLDQQAVATKRATRAANSLHSRMSQTDIPKPGSGSVAGQLTAAQRMIAAGRTRRGEVA